MESLLLNVLLILLFLLYLVAVEVGDMLYSVLILAAGNTTMAVVFYIMQAPDIALTQAAVGAGVSTVLLVNAINRTRRKE